MITKPTVLVLGAGSSAQFDFPTGSALKDLVVNNLQDEPTSIEIARLADSTKSEVAEFLNSLQKSGVDSVDAFLEYRPRFLKIGRLSIAYALIPFENEQRLYEINTPNWYKYIFNLMSASESEFGKNSISFLTFNYDRSLEFFLHDALQHKYEGLGSDQAATIFERVPIIHLHGRLGYLPWQTGDPKRQYSKTINNNDLPQIAEMIKIVHDESLSTEPQFKEAKLLLEKAEQIIFLGFGYYEKNITRLGIEQLRGKGIHGSGFGLKGAEVTRIKRLFPFGIDIGHESFDVLNYIREKVIWA